MTDTPPPIVLNWLDKLQLDGKSHHTIQAYRQGIQHFLCWYARAYQDHFKPAQVMPRDIRDWQAHQQQTEKSAPATVNQRLAAVKQFFKWAQQHHGLHQNPADDVSTTHINHRNVKSLDDPSLHRLLREAKTDVRDYAILEVLIGTGIRVGELLALKVGDIVVHPRSGQLTVRYGKGGGYRDIPLTRDVRQALQAYLETAHPNPDDAQQKLWWGRDGAIRHRSSITRMLDKYAIRAGLGHVTAHMLRHTFATRYLRANRDDLRGLARLLGHASLDTVMIYTEPTLDDLEQRLERMESGTDPHNSPAARLTHD
jgi:integrase/recombinase XerC